MGFYKYLQQSWKKPSTEMVRQKYIAWRKEESVVRVEHPTRLDRARALGYKAKTGFIVLRSHVKKGGRTRALPEKARKPAHSGRTRYSPKLSKQVIAEQRAARHYPNLEVLNSYWVGDDGVTKYYEVIMVDPHSPSIISDKDINWICESQHTKRVYRGLTSAGKKSRGLRYKGKGSEKARPSMAANIRKAGTGYHERAGQGDPKANK